jgi:ketosteroid isomerase-like protein
VSERNKAIARSEFEVWSTGEVEKLDDMVAADVVHHDPYDPNATGGLEGRDMRIDVEDQVAEGDKVTTRWTAIMTHEGQLGDTPATGRRVTLRGITIERFEDGKVVEAWRSMDTSACCARSGRFRRSERCR